MDCRTPNGGLACRLGRCFCFAEVSTGHPHRNDRATAYCTHHTVFVATKRLVILSAEHERIRNTLQKKETDCRSRLHGFAMTGSVRTAYRASRGIRNDKGGTDYRHILLHNKRGLLIRLFGIKSNIR